MLRLLLCAMFITACSRADSTRTRAVTVDTVPVVDMHDADVANDEVFELPSGATILSNGNIVVNDYYGATLTFFDPSGKLIRKVGGHGKGPNEFGGALRWLGSCKPDSMFVFVFDKGQIAVIDSAGKVVRTITPDPRHIAPCHNEPYAAYWNINMTRRPREGDPPLRGTLEVGHIEADALVDFGEFVGGEYGPLRPFTRAFTRGGKVYIGSGQTGAVHVYSMKGKKLKTIETGANRRDITAAHYDAALERYVNYLVIRQERIEMKERMRQWYSQPSKGPAYSSFYVDDENALWAVTSLPGDGETRIRVIDVDNGTLLGEVNLPVELTILEIGSDYLLASFEDEEGFPHVAKYDVRRIRSDGPRARASS